MNYWRNTGASTWTDLEGSDNGTPAGSPSTILLPEGTTSGKDILGFPLTNPNNGWLNLSPNPNRISTDPAPLVIPNSSVFEIRNKSVSIEFWMKTDFTGVKEIIEWQSPSAGLQFVANSVANKIRFDIWNGSGVAIDSATTVNDNVWHHIVGIRNADTNKNHLWIDNTEDANSDVSATNVGDVIIDSDIWVGAGNGTDSWDGSIDEIRWYNRALSEPEIEKNYNHGLSKHS